MVANRVVWGELGAWSEAAGAEHHTEHILQVLLWLYGVTSINGWGGV